MARVFRKEDMRDPYLRRVQKTFDGVAFDRRYADLSNDDSKVRHVREHIGKAEFKLVNPSPRPVGDSTWPKGPAAERGGAGPANLPLPTG